MGKEYLRASTFTGQTFSAVIYYLGETVAIFHFQHHHGRHDRFAGLFGNPNGYVVFRLLFQKGAQ